MRLLTIEVGTFVGSGVVGVDPPSNGVEKDIVSLGPNSPPLAITLPSNAS